MAGSINKVILVGNLGKDPEVKHSQDGNKIVTFNVATSENWKDKNGEKKDRTEWHRVVIFSPGLAEVAEKYLKKGSKVMQKDNFAPVNGKMLPVPINIQQKLYCQVLMLI